MLQEMLPYVGIALQWARAQKGFAELWYVGIVAISSFVFYMLAHPSDAFAVPWATVLSGWWDQAKTVLAMTQVASSSSYIVRDATGKSSKMVPVTDSQGG